MGIGGAGAAICWNCSFRGPQILGPRILHHLFHVWVLLHMGGQSLSPCKVNQKLKDLGAVGLKGGFSHRRALALGHGGGTAVGNWIYIYIYINEQ